MPNKESHVFGVPFALILFVVLLAIFIDGFMWFGVRPVLENRMDQDTDRVLQQRVVLHDESHVASVSAMPSVTATPSVSRVFVPTKEVQSYVTPRE